MSKPLGIVIPVYNEAGNIGATLRKIRSSVSTEHTVYLVHDFPEDDTLPAAAPFREEGMDIVFLENPERGVANAIRRGLREAVHEVLLVTMGDACDDHAVIDSMYALLAGGCDVVCGSRYAKGGRLEGGPLLKSLLSRAAGLSLYWLGAVPVSDVTNNFKMYRRSMLEGMEITSDGGFEIAMEITVKAAAAGYRIAEVPCSWTERTRGKSRFLLFTWMPKYLKWYGYALKARFRRAGGTLHGMP
jgi:dolichol-phosphate mannosyltransferase